MMKKMAASVVALSWAWTAPSHGDMTYTLVDDGTGQVALTGTGSGVVSASHFDGDWDHNNWPMPFLFEAAGPAGYRSGVVTGSLVNLTTGVSVAIQEIQLDRDLLGGDDLLLDTDGPIGFSAGDQFSFTMTAGKFANLEGEPFLFSFLAPGPHVYVGDPNNSNDEIFGTVTINVGSCPGDIDGNNAVGLEDVLAILADWGATGGPADLNLDGQVGLADLLVVLGSWGPC
ncbi:MAG: hypothetical protein AB8G96_09895 [Phycisphaerales bacterium]